MRVSSAWSTFSTHRAPLAALAATPLALLGLSTVVHDEDESLSNDDETRSSQPLLQLPRILATSDANADRSTSNASAQQIRYNSNNIASSTEDSYPTFTRYHNSLLKKYLSRPLWDKLSPLKTSLGTTLEDMIAPGLALPLGANPPRNIGLLVGDTECYTLYEELLNPIIEEYHGVTLEKGEWEDPELPREGNFIRQRYFPHLERLDTDHSTHAQDGIIKSGGPSDEHDDDDFREDDEVYDTNREESSAASQKPKSRPNLRRHSTIINNPLLVTSQQADPNNEYILSTRIRIARSLDGIRLPSTMSRVERRQVQSLIRDCCKNFYSHQFKNGVFLPILEMTTDQNLDFIERHILFDNPNEWTIASGMGRDWPDGRALYTNVSNPTVQTPDFMIWINEEDHVRIMCLRPGGDIKGVFTTVMTGVRELERELRIRGWEFAFHPKLGYLTSCPTNLGTTMRASVHLKLVKLGCLEGFHELCKALQLEARGKYGETDRRCTGVFDISNAERLGKSEVHLINQMVEGVTKLIDLERALEKGEDINCREIAEKLRSR